MGKRTREGFVAVDGCGRKIVRPGDVRRRYTTFGLVLSRETDRFVGEKSISVRSSSRKVDRRTWRGRRDTRPLAIYAGIGRTCTYRATLPETIRDRS